MGILEEDLIPSHLGQPFIFCVVLVLVFTFSGTRLEQSICFGMLVLRRVGFTVSL